LRTLTSRAAVVASFLVIAARTDAIGEAAKAVLTVSTTVPPKAEIVAIHAPRFGGDDRTAEVSSSAVQSLLTIRATRGTPYRICIAPDGAIPSGTDRLYRHARQRVGWDDGCLHPSTRRGALGRTVSARPRRGAHVAAGSATDTLSVTIEW